MNDPLLPRQTEADPLVGAACATHTETQATILCSLCGDFACDECCFGRVVGREACTACASDGFDEAVPWERRKQIGVFRALRATTKAVCRQPAKFFATPPTEEGLFPPIFYGAAIYTVGQLIFTLQLALATFLGGVMVASSSSSDEGMVLIVTSGIMLVAGIPMILVQSPAYAVLGILGGAAMSHGTLAVLKERRRGFEDSVRAIAFANAPYWYYWIPCVGPVVAFFWVIVAETKALRSVHATTTDKAALATVGYRVVLFLVFGGTYALMIGLVVAAASQPVPY